MQCENLHQQKFKTKTMVRVERRWGRIVGGDMSSDDGDDDDDDAGAHGEALCSICTGSKQVRTS